MRGTHPDRVIGSENWNGIAHLSAAIAGIEIENGPRWRNANTVEAAIETVTETESANATAARSATIIDVTATGAVSVMMVTAVVVVVIAGN